MMGKSTYTVKEQYAKKFGLSAAQIRFFDELTVLQRGRVAAHYSLHGAGQYVYAAKRGGGLVWHREKRDLLMEQYHDG